jgi:Flp pilus assembly protein protease CpaA
MGAGDVKLWMAMFWALPDSNIPSLILLIFLSFLLTGFAQMLWRILRNQPASGVKSHSPRWRVPGWWSMRW